MSYTVKIGPIELGAPGDLRSKFEVPEEFDDGVDVHLGVHHFIDEVGKPVIRTHGMGAFPAPQAWSAELYGDTALERHLAFKRLASLQQEVDLVYGPLHWKVVISKYSGKIKHQHCVYYTINLVVTKDMNATAVLSDSGTSFDLGTEQLKAIADKHMAAVAAQPVVLPSTIIKQQQTVDTSLQNAAPLKYQDPTTIRGISAQIDTLISNIQSYIGPLQKTAQSTMMQGVVQDLSAASDAYGLFNANLKTLSGDGTVVARRSEQMSAGTSLYRVAARYYPSQDAAATAAIIAKANKMTSYFLPNKRDLVLPPVFNTVA